MVDPTTGELVTDRYRVDTIQPATPETVLTQLGELRDFFGHHGPTGVGFPAVVRRGVVETAMNIDRTWIDVNLAKRLEKLFGRTVPVLNDADAAAIAEVSFGAACGTSGLVVVITFGTGIGSGLVIDGVLAPNVELGVIELDGHVPAENHFAASARKRENLSWDEWGLRANRYLSHIDRVFSPRRIVVGGGAAKRWELFSHHLDAALPVVRATMGNNAGIVGAAIRAASR